MKPFKIALCGLFQTGKSTTINALADGREICAQSKISGIRTSACNIYIYGAPQEKCYLELISDAEICSKLKQILDYDVEEDDLWKYQKREFLWQQLKNVWQNEKNDSEQIEEVSLLLSGIGFLPFLRKKVLNMSVENVALFEKAPDDELIRWSKFRRKVDEMNVTQLKHFLREEFPIQEVLYPFVKKIVVHLNILQLRENNICVIDTPGLNANSNDTTTAMQAIQQSDAVLYILGGNKEPCEFERQFLYNLHPILGNKKITFAVNCLGKEKPNVINAIESILRICDYKDVKIVTYNAALELHKAQGIKLLERPPLRSLVKSLISKAKFEGFDVINAAQAWSSLTAQDLKVVSNKDSKLINKLGLCKESIDILQSYSNLTKIICKIQSYA